ncbi:MAG: LPS export ABC transporter periplasmic protein LptC [Gammaproteobacteria bacterium]|nr:LPS export ABC transporter periplasmic protein LptC [Gammaproteobacteria bacterium]
MNFFKGRAILWLLIPVTIIIAFLWDRTPAARPDFIQEKSNPDYYLVKTISYEYKADGQIERQFASDQTLHYLFRQETAMQSSVLTFTNAEQETWQVTAKNAVSKEMTEELFLSDGVSISMINPEGQVAKLTTDKLTIDFATENAFTDGAVLLTNNLYQLTAVGMNADLKENQIHFKSQVVSEEL